MATHNFINIAERFGTPLYIYEAERLKANLGRMLSDITYPFSKVYFAAMCNGQFEVLKIIRHLGLGIQVNSKYELTMAKEAGFSTSDISFTSTGISKSMMQRLIQEGIELNLDSVEEVEKFCASTSHNSFGIRIRIDKKIHVPSTQTTNNYTESNVGIAPHDFQRVKEISRKSGNRIIGIHGYLASNVLDTQPFIEFADLLSTTALEFPDLEYVNFSSGFGVASTEKDNDFDLAGVLRHYAFLLRKLSNHFRREIKLVIEPGRIILADVGSLLVRVTNVKNLSPEKSEISVDAGFAEFPRPRIYHSYHEIENVDKKGIRKRLYDIRGNTVLQNDFLGQDRILEEVKEGDYLVVKKVGAYGIVMASGFPGKKLPRQILINNGSIDLL